MGPGGGRPHRLGPPPPPPLGPGGGVGGDRLGGHVGKKTRKNERQSPNVLNESSNSRTSFRSAIGPI